MVDFWLYRTAMYHLGFEDRRAIFGETWLTFEPPISQVDTRIAMQIAVQRWSQPWQDPTYDQFAFTERFHEQLWPKPSYTELVSNVDFQLLNSNAPEACYRLQRVGATGALGRVLLPILTDAAFTDLPHRRHVNLSVLVPLLNAYLNTQDQSFTFSGRTYFNVIFNRKTFTWDYVDHYALLENPVRRWQRWRPYPLSRIPSDSGWQPKECIP